MTNKPDIILDKASKLLENTSYTPLPFKVSNRIVYALSHSPCYASNGYAIRTKYVAAQLQSQGIDVLGTVRLGRPWVMQERKVDTDILGLSEGVKYLHTPWPDDVRPASEVKRFEMAVENFLTQFRIFKPSLVMAASNHDVALPALVAARLLQLPFFYEVRGFWEESYIARKGSSVITAKEYQRQYQRETFTCRAADQIFTLNNAMRDELVSRGVAVHKIHCIPNSLDKNTYENLLSEANRPKPKSHTHVLGYVGTLSNYEGLDLALSALALLKHKHDLHLIIVGGSGSSVSSQVDTESYEYALREEAKRLGVEENVTFTGRVPADQALSYYAQMDTLILPRKPLRVCELVSGLKPIEYMATGKNIIASDIAPHREVFDDGRSAWLFDKGSDSSFAKAVEAVLSSTKHQRKEKIAVAQQAVRTKYSWDNSIKPLLAEILEKMNQN